jgi:RNA polymerase sigma-70 factor (ECF subfamily)
MESIVYTNNKTADQSPKTVFIRDLKSGNADRFETLVRDNGGRMLAVARRYLRNEADAQDCVQDAFIQAYKNIKNFEQRSSVETWLHRIVVNTALMKIRSTKRRPEDLIEDKAELFDDNGMRLEMEAEISLSVEEVVVTEETRTTIRQHINQLPETPRKLLLLRDIEGYNTEETANLLGMTVGNVKTGLHRARLLLKKSLLELSSLGLQETAA